MDDYTGKRIDGRYEIQEVIGVGGMADIYKATDLTENRTVAVKILKDDMATDEPSVMRFINEFLSPTEHNVLMLSLSGFSYADISRRLGISRKAVNAPETG